MPASPAGIFLSARIPVRLRVSLLVARAIADLLERWRENPRRLGQPCSLMSAIPARIGCLRMEHTLEFDVDGPQDVTSALVAGRGDALLLIETRRGRDARRA